MREILIANIVLLSVIAVVTTILGIRTYIIERELAKYEVADPSKRKDK